MKQIGLVARQDMNVGDCFTRVWKHYARLARASDPQITGICGLPTNKGEKIWMIIDPGKMYMNLKTDN